MAAWHADSAPAALLKYTPMVMIALIPAVIRITTQNAGTCARIERSMSPPATAWAEGAQLNGRPPATASAEGRQLNGAPSHYTSYEPKSPCGRKNRTASKRANATASRRLDETYPVTMASTTPSSNPTA